MSKLTPFADDAASTSIGSLTVENGTDRIALSGSLDLTRDKAGLAPGPRPEGAGGRRGGAPGRREGPARGGARAGRPEVGSNPFG